MGEIIPTSPDQAPLRPLQPCPQCGALCLVGTYDHDGRWRALPELRSPVFGKPHQCSPTAQEKETL